MNLKSHKQSGFMLEEVMIALVVTSILIMPVLNFIGNVMKSSIGFRDSSTRLFVMKNFMLEQNYKAQEDKQKKKNENKKEKDSAITLKYTRDQVGKQKPFNKFSEEESKNLLVQKVEASFGKRLVQKETIVCLLYKS